MWLPVRPVILAVAICLHVCSRSLTDGVQFRGEGKISNEPACSHDAFHCYNETDFHHRCIPRSWVCDGAKDCASGEDEKVDCAIKSCGEGFFTCKTGTPFCITQGFVCDNDKDCSDGSDETPNECLGHKSGTYVRGQEVDMNFRCLPNQYQCPNSQHCIDIERVCDSVIDCLENGADEGHHCANYACKRQTCEYKCRETIKGPQCYCLEGFQANKTGGVCEDYDECGYDVSCDQHCVNTRGSYTCSCSEGYTNGTGANQGRCFAKNSGDAQLLVTNYMNLLLLDLSSSSSKKNINITGNRITSVDFNIKNNSACWTSYNQEKGQTELQCSDMTNSAVRWTIDTHFKLSSVHQIALDWISGNWYFVDDKRDRIFLCTSNGKHCLSVIYHGISRPKGIAIDASRGLIFYADWSSSPKIGRANLDGSNVNNNLVVKKIVHPSVITLDYANQHVYWADSFLNLIARVDYDGSNRRTVFEDTDIKPHYGLTLFENYLYVSNLRLHNHSVVRLHRYNRTVDPLLIKKNLIKPGALQVVHKVRQPGNEKTICESKCDHICIPLPDDQGSVTATCTCRAGFSLVDGAKCEKKIPDQFLIYANAQQGNIRGISLDASITHDVMEPIHGLNRPIALAYHAETGDIYFSDVSMLRIGRRNVDSDREADVFLHSGVTSCEGLAVDWVGKNLYWTDDGHQTINVVKLNDTSKVYTIINNTNHPRSIVIDPNEGYMYWIDLLWRPPAEINATIAKAAMDGSNQSDLVILNITWPNSLTLDTVNHRLYWTDAYSDTIESINTDGTDRRIERHLEGSGHRHPYGIALHNGMLYWTESLKGYVDTYVNNQTVHLHSDSKPLFDLILFDKHGQTTKPDHPCSENNGNCSDLCLSVPAGKVCVCANGRRLKKDGLSCEDIPGYPHPPVCDKAFKFECANGECVNKNFLCDGDYDCKDKSDEATSEHGACSNTTCPDESMFQCGNKRCIYAQFVCDGESDCIDGTDENVNFCNNDRKCPANYTRCNNTGRCIPESWRCDHDKDCADGSDEDESCGYPSCGPGQIKCLSGRCIPYMYRCDNEYDCKDHSDEWDCSDWCDPLLEFKCANSTICLPKIYQCDNEYNCPDKSDEANCTSLIDSHCDKTREFQCYSGGCIAKIWTCDGDKDCQDGSDEMNCTEDTSERTCHPFEFRCEDKSRCIPMSWKCDMDKDCDDTSDEKNCRQPCVAPNFTCPQDNNTCIEVNKLCDGRPDCPDGSDEHRLCDYNMCINNDCSHNCHKSPDGFVCSCPENMRLGSNRKTCVSIDVCEKWGICSQKCVNTPDGHQCHCHPGYTLANDRYSCKPNDSVPIYIIYSNRHEIRRYDLGTMNYFSLISGLRNTIALDFHYAHKWIFWTDVVDDKIYRGHMISNTITDIKAIIDVGLATTEGLAIDWIADNIYWVESNLDQIEVAKLDGSNRSTLVAGNMISPRAIVLDPRDGVLFWTDWDGQKPRIEGCSMSGDDRKIIYDITKVPGGGWPNGLTLDYEARRLYWVDARSDSVHTITYDGKDHHLIVHSHDALAHPFALTMFELYVYWTDWRTNSLVRANKFNGSDVLTIQRTFTQPFDLQVYHPKRQPQAPNPCKDNNGGCSHLCLISGGNRAAVCKCPHRMKLNEDLKNCTADNKFLLFVKENEIRGVDLNNAHFNVIPSITVPFVENATAIDYDSKEDKLYWTDKKRNVIRSAFINGTGVETVIDSGISNPEGFAIDWLSRNMYFSSYDDQKASISVAKLNGAFRTEIVSNSPSYLRKPNSIAVHPKKGLMFWSDLGGEKHQIIKANMDGSMPTVIVQDAKQPASLTIDVTSNKLYWISRGRQTVLVCNLDGSNSHTFPKDSSVVSPMSMTIYDNTIYIANTTTILKFNTDMNNEVVLMRDNTPHVYAMQVYDPSVREGGSNGCSNEKNGGCEQMCLPTGNISRICKCTAGFTPMENKCHGIDSFLLYSTDSEIRGFSLNETQSEALAPISKISLAASVDFHAALDSIFWVDSNSRTISRIKRDLTSRETVVEHRINGIEGIAVDWIAGNIYWTDRGSDTIEVSDLNGTNRYVVMHGDMEKPKAIAVHPVAGYVFFSDWGSQPKIVRARLDGSERENWIDTDIKSPYGLTIDYKSNTMYWCDKVLDTIERVEILTRHRKTIVGNLTDCVSLAVYGKYIYWADSTQDSGSIKRALKKDGSGVITLKSNIKKLRDIKVFDRNRQIGSNICQGNQHGCKELCLFKGNNSASCACSYGKLSSDGKTCEEYNAFLLFSEVTSLQSIHMKHIPDPNDPTPPISNATSMKNVIGLAFDHETQRIFYSDIQIGNIQCVTYNGTYVEEIVSGVGAAEGLAFDSRTQNLLWTSYTNSSISRINLGAKPKDRSVKVLIQLTGEDHPRAIVIDVCKNKMFWTNWNDQKPSIQTSSLEGYRVESIITKNIRTPNGLAIDHKGQRLYWTDARLDKIERCHFDGSNRVVIVTKIPQHSFGIAVYGDYLYWTDWMLRAVLRAYKYDGTGLAWLKKGIKRQPMGIIAVTNDTNDCSTNPCFGDNAVCDELCSVSATGDVVCGCIEGHKLLPDKWRCADASLNCSMHDFVCDDKRRCVPITKTCNGINDCLDASDESTLCDQTRECPSGYFTCSKTKRCITLDKICDGKTDCGGEDESDEKDCPCKDDEFQCANKMCINMKYRCDRDSDCPDHSDEIGCNLTCSELEIDGEFLEGLVSCKTTSACIYPSWKCDGSNDCWDNSDEMDGCHKTGDQHCPDKDFTCKSGSCIPPQWHCDKDNDCGDNSDEDNCTYSCDKNQFQCNDSSCIPSTWQCDGHPDCGDGSDESAACQNRTCDNDKFKCEQGRCIPNTWKCDSDPDCDNGADESHSDAECPEAPRCEPDEFTCDNRRCIRQAFYCDHDNDCGDGSDEPPSCVIPECLHNQFRCANKGLCIPLKDRCNGLFDCPDHSDEKECDVSPCGNVTQFQCKNHVCINEDLVCNGHNDCGDMSDEPEQCGVNECLAYQRNMTHMCTQKCRDKKIGYECDCRDGFKLLADNKTCIDVDECNSTYPCSHYCANTVGSYICGCPEHYRLDVTKHKCKVKGNPPRLLVSNRYYIREVEFPRGNMTILTDKLYNSVAIDYDWKGQYIYWSDITSVNSSINRMSLTGSSKKPEVLHSTTVRNPDGLAVDWIGRNLYWCDKTTDTIEVSKLNGTFRKVLLRDGLQEPRGLEVFPARGFLFFTDWGDSPHISRMWMDGTNRQTVIKDNLAWPNALTIDYVTEKIFWADGSLDYIAMANLDGSGRRIVVSDNWVVPHVFALATFESYIIWSDWEKTGVFYADKFSGKNITMLAKMVHRPMDIQVLHEYRQIPGQNDSEYSPCRNNGGCSHLCLLRPALHNSYSKIEAICACPENHYLGTDKKSCISNCTNAQFLCATSSKCIPKWWYCDNHADCEDSSDEPPHNCSTYHCDQSGLFQCKNASSKADCYVPTVICDGEKQCLDGSDEEDCEIYPCMEHQFKCQKSNVCISKTMQCNGHSDCSDGEDEKNCPKSACNSNQFSCENGRCVPYVWRCDHDNDCGDGSDELKNCTILECKGDHTKCNISGRCIPNAWKCDGDPDCGEHDDTDENYEECHLRTCDPTYFHCDNGHCIPGRWKCDYYDDCRDGSDEKKCTPRNCSEAEMKCDNGKCIRKNLHCDGEVHCEDGSDEKNCVNKTCDSQTEFKCEKVVHCIPKSWHCDGDTDCADGTDELKCNRTCTKGEFRCDNSLCMPLLWQCDGDDDCGDGSDENSTLCADFDCAPGRFRCDNNICIWGSMVCDGNKDCANGSDEKNCHEDSKCHPLDFKCFKSHQCISQSLVCDDTPHCEDKTDEDKTYCGTVKAMMNCTVKNGGCEQICKQLTHGVKCLCKDGFKLSEDSFHCDPINPCEKWGICSQKCNFSEATMHHYCYCQEGFRRNFGQEGSCSAIGLSPNLLIAERTKVIQSPTIINMTSLNDSFAKPLNVTWVQHGNNSTIIAMDVDTTGPDPLAFVVTEANNRWIVNQYTLKNSGSKRVTRDVKKDQDPLWMTHAKIADISLDWIMGRIYYIDATTKSIQLRSYNGQHQVHIIDSGLNQPCSIAVDPHSGKLFWTEQGARPKIGSAYLDGSNRTTLVRYELEWPNGIAVDHQNGWVYWCDTKKSTVETVSVDGKGRTIVHRFNETDPPYKIEVFEDYLYVLTYKKNHLLKLNKFGRQNKNLQETQAIYTPMERINAIVIIQENKMNKNLTNNCKPSGSQKSKCPSGMCFNDLTNLKGTGFKCKCPKHSKMKDEKCDFKEPCASYCQNGGNCTLTIYKGPKCSCPPGFKGDRCDIDRCQNYCLNKGTCSRPTALNTAPTCSCPAGYSGTRCELYMCTNFCRNGGNCYIKEAKPKCQCDVQHTGDRCEKNKTLKCEEYCVPNNYQNCTIVNGQSAKCFCKEGFKGQKCEHCDELFCYNSGICVKDKGEMTCECKYNYDPTVQCREHTCDYKCRNNLWKGNCKCVGKCPGPDCRADKESLCDKYCHHGGICSIKSGHPVCECNEVYQGVRCGGCKCEPGGECYLSDEGKYQCRCKFGYLGRHCQLACSSVCHNNGECSGCHLGQHGKAACRFCICKGDFSGDMCEVGPPATAATHRAPLNPLYIIVPAVALVVLMLFILAVVFYRRRKRLEQYGHKRMKEPNRMDVKNPMYMRHEEEADERDPLGSNPIFRGDASTNFANPMYDVYNTSESMQMLLNQELPQDCEENQLLEEGSNVRYFGTSDTPLKLPKA